MKENKTTLLHYIGLMKSKKDIAGFNKLSKSLDEFIKIRDTKITLGEAEERLAKAFKYNK